MILLFFRGFMRGVVVGCIGMIALFLLLIFTFGIWGLAQ